MHGDVAYFFQFLSWADKFRICREVWTFSAIFSAFSVIRSSAWKLYRPVHFEFAEAKDIVHLLQEEDLRIWKQAPHFMWHRKVENISGMDFNAQFQVSNVERPRESPKRFERRRLEEKEKDR